MKPRHQRLIQLGTCLTMALTAPVLTGLGGCAVDAPASDAGMIEEVSLAVRFHQPAEDQQAETQGLFGALALAPADNEYTDVDRILVDVLYADTGDAFMLGFSLEKVADDNWQAQIPFLPSDTELRFIGHGFNADNDEIFTGETLVTLTVNGSNVVIPLAPAQDDETFDMPRMVRIAYPEEIIAGQEVQMIFTLEGNAGESIDYAITNLDGTVASAFSPSAGTVTLTGTIADFIGVYAAPEVDADTDFQYLVTITSADALSSVAVETTLTTTIVPRPDGIDGVNDTRPSVRFNPVVLELTANGTATPGAVELFADISDDGDPADLTFQWAYTPADGSPAASYTDATANPANFEGYTIDHQGTITLAVTDANGGTTTLFYELVREQFADIVDHEAVNGLKKIVAGTNHTCVLTGEGKVRCWGDGQQGQLGYGNALDVGASPDHLPSDAGDVPLLPDENVVQLVAGDNHTCALLDFGFIRCWGDNQSGQLGYNRTEDLADGEPVTSFGYVSLGGVATKIAAGGDHTCAILEGGTLRCWGRNNVGQLGHGNNQNIGDDETVFSAGNVDLGAGVVVRDIALGVNHTCALLDHGDDTGKMRCWGLNSSGQLGYGHNQNIGDNEALTDFPLVDVSLPGPVRKISAGFQHTCALLENGAMRCWGNESHGQLGFNHGNTNYGDQSGEIPLNLNDIAVGAEVTDIAVGDDHTCALLSDSRLKCWGEGGNGRLGYGNASDITVPRADGIDLDGVSVYQLAAGGAHTCALRSNGTARCWGLGNQGQLGYGSTASISTPSTAGDIQVFEP